MRRAPGGRAAMLCLLALALVPAPAGAFLEFDELRGSAGIVGSGTIEGTEWLDRDLRFTAGVSRELGRRLELRLDARTSSRGFALDLVQPEDAPAAKDAESVLRRHGFDLVFRWVAVPGSWGFLHLDAGLEGEYREVREGGGIEERYRGIGPSLGAGFLIDGPGRRFHGSAGYARWFLDGRNRGASDDGQADRFRGELGFDVRLLPAAALGIVAGAERTRFQAPTGSARTGAAWWVRDRYLPWEWTVGARLLLRLR